MSLRPVFLFTVSISVPAGNGKQIRLFFPLPIFCVNDFVESIADIASLFSFFCGKAKVKVSEPSKRSAYFMTVRSLARAIYVLSDVLTELTLFTGRFDMVDVDVTDGDERCRVKVSTF